VHAREPKTGPQLLDDIIPHSRDDHHYLEPALRMRCRRALPIRAPRYFVADRVDSKPGRPVFNRTVTLRDSWGKDAK